MDEPVDAQISAIARIGAVPAILRVVQELSGLRMASVARITADLWTCCAVIDQTGLGMKPGRHLDIETMLCREVRDARAPVVINHASLDSVYCTHPATKIYGFESYLGVPIITPSGVYFGNLLAADPRPSPPASFTTISSMQLFAELIALQL